MSTPSDPGDVRTVPQPAAARASSDADDGFRPYVPAATVLPEMTLKVFIVGIILSWIMSAANAYLGLYAGLTVSAAIPASVVSMAVLRFFRRRNILENNLIQTTASAGEAVTAGIVFVLPALLLIAYWDQIGLWQTMVVAALGGSLGVLFTIPLRRAFIVDAKLQYPEGVATVEVLKSGEKGGSGVAYIAAAGLIGALMKLASGGLGLWRGTWHRGWRTGDWAVYLGTNVSPALLGVGFIVGLHIASLIFAGSLITYALAIPIYWNAQGFPDATDLAGPFDDARSSHLRFLGVGGMIVGGVYTLVRLLPVLVRSVRSSWQAFQAVKRSPKETNRHELDLSLPTLGKILAVVTVGLAALFLYFTTDAFEVWSASRVAAALVLCLVMIVMGFLFSAVAGYMAGVVGSSNNPISGVAIGTLLFTGLLLLLFGLPGPTGAAATILIGCTIAAAAAIAGDNMQDLKAGYLLGGTPRNLQILQLVGTLAAAISLPFVLVLLHSGQGIGSTALPAPQAGLMATIARGLFRLEENVRPIPWDLVGVGALLALGIILLDLALQRLGKGPRLYVMAIAVGMYLPFSTTAPIFLGGLVAFLVGSALRRRSPRDAPSWRERRMGRGVLFASGLIAGEALMGILLAAFFLPALGGGKNIDGDATTAFAVFEAPTWAWEGGILLAFVAFLLYYVCVRRARDEAS